MKKLFIILLTLSSVPVFPDAPVDRRYDEKKLQFRLDNFLKRKESVIQKRRTLQPFLIGGGVCFLVVSTGFFLNILDVHSPKLLRRRVAKSALAFGVVLLGQACYQASNIDAHESELRRKLNRRESIIRERLEEAKKRSKV